MEVHGHGRREADSYPLSQLRSHTESIKGVKSIKGVRLLLYEETQKRTLYLLLKLNVPFLLPG